MKYCDTNIDLMIEQAIDAEWERLNRPDGETLRQAAKCLNRAIEGLDRAADDVNEASETLVDTPAGDRVASILHDMEDLLCDLKSMANAYERGEKA